MAQLKEKTFEQKFKSEQKEKKIHDRKALSGIYKKSFVYGDDIDGLNGFNAYNQTMAHDIIYRLILKDFKHMTSDRKHKCTLKTFIRIKILVYRIKTDENGDEYEETEQRWFNSNTYDILAENNINRIVNDIILHFDNFLEKSLNGSNWLFKSFIKFTVASSIIKSALGKSYIELPAVLKNKKAIINIKNEDDRCFDYSLIASKLHKKN